MNHVSGKGKTSKTIPRGLSIIRAINVVKSDIKSFGSGLFPFEVDAIIENAQQIINLCNLLEDKENKNGTN